MNDHSLTEALEILGLYLKDNGLHYELVAIGGASLLLLGFMIRPTKDIDIVALIDDRKLISAHPLPTQLGLAIKEVGLALGYPSNWINTAPADLLTMGLPKGFQNRLNPLHFSGLTLYCASRYDQICFKLYASVDHEPSSKHFEDLKKLNPTQEELKDAAEWCKTHDISEPFAECLSEVLLQLRG